MEPQIPITGTRGCDVGSMHSTDGVKIRRRKRGSSHNKTRGLRATRNSRGEQDKQHLFIPVTLDRFLMENAFF